VDVKASGSQMASSPAVEGIAWRGDFDLDAQVWHRDYVPH
jgi:hypothetical protein